MKEIKAPDKVDFFNDFTIFLAGSIEMGSAKNWQEEISKELENFDVTLVNPRRDVWDSTWEQSIKNPEFKKQVEWELDGLRFSKVILFYFDPNTKSPISLMELGYRANFIVRRHFKQDIFVYCPEGFWRKGNVDILCDQSNIPVYTKFEDFMNDVKTYLKVKNV